MTNEHPIEGNPIGEPAADLTEHDRDPSQDSAAGAGRVREDGIEDEDNVEEEDDEALNKPPFKIGDSVVVKPGEIDPGSDQPIGGWQGRVMGYHEEDPLLVDIAWDSATLRGMSMEWMARSELEGLDWSRMYLEFDTLDPATPRDTEEEAEAARKELHTRVVEVVDLTGNLYELQSGKAVLALLDEQPTRDQHAVHAAWHTYLQQALRLPFVAEVATRDHPPLRQGDRVTVRAIARLDDQEGIMVRVQGRRDTVEIPLIALKIGTPSAANYRAVADYTEWLQDQKDLEAPILFPPSAFLHL